MSNEMSNEKAQNFLLDAQTKVIAKQQEQIAQQAKTITRLMARVHQLSAWLDEADLSNDKSDE